MRARGLLTGVVRWAWSQQIDQGDDGRGKILPGNGIEAAVQLFGECAFVRPPMMRPHDIAEPEDWVFASLLGHVDIGSFETVSGPANLSGNGYREMNKTDKDEFPSAEPITQF